MISRHGQSDIYDLTFSMGYPVRSAGYIFCYNRRMIHLASVFSGGSFGREEEDFDLTQGSFCIMVYLPSMNKGKHGFAGQKSAHTASILLTIRKVCSAGLSLSGCISARQNCKAPANDGSSSDFCFLRCRRRPPRRKGQKRRKDTLPGVIALVHRWYRTWYQKWTLTGQNSCQRSVRKVSGSCQKSARSGETLL